MELPTRLPLTPIAACNSTDKHMFRTAPQHKKQPVTYDIEAGGLTNLNAAFAVDTYTETLYRQEAATVMRR